MSLLISMLTLAHCNKVLFPSLPIKIPSSKSNSNLLELESLDVISNEAFDSILKIAATRVGKKLMKVRESSSKSLDLFDSNDDGVILLDLLTRTWSTWQHISLSSSSESYLAILIEDYFIKIGNATNSTNGTNSSNHSDQNLTVTMLLSHNAIIQKAVSIGFATIIETSYQHINKNAKNHYYVNALVYLLHTLPSSLGSPLALPISGLKPSLSLMILYSNKGRHIIISPSYTITITITIIIK